ncbi:hypothetical protein [Methanoregula sp. UBA64]|jgi:hypothetical protein|uniref:hypothetical protein n=1 Tax=Methanoregula sp. UBA64 TaxID=1915554 RepID=UPI0025CBA135|nr:hypothetical protein [Methanoregula sp. UBA64]
MGVIPDNGSGEGVYFSLKEIGLILGLSVLAALTGALVPSYLFPEGTISAIVYGTLMLPGPGAGVFVFGSILCFWLFTGLILVKKPGTAVAMATVLVAIDLLFGIQAVIIQSLDVLVIVAIIIEVVCHFLPKHSAGDRIFPLILAALSIITLGIAITGYAKQGEENLPLMQFPIVYGIFAILGISLAIVCYRYPCRYFIAAGIANIYYLIHFWIFWGNDFGSRFPPDPLMIPVLSLIVIVGGVTAAWAACGLEYLRKRKASGNRSTPASS